MLSVAQRAIVAWEPNNTDAIFGVRSFFELNPTASWLGITGCTIVCCLQSGALIFLVALHKIAAASWRWPIRFTLQIPIDSIPVNRNAAGILKGLQTAANDVSIRRQAARVFIE